MLPPRVHIPEDVVTRLLYEADHTCCICRNKKFDVQIHHIAGRMDPSPKNLIVLCLNCHSEVERKGGLGRSYSAKELRHYKSLAVREIRMRRRRAKEFDRSLVSFEIRRLMYKFLALDSHECQEPRALEVMRLVMQFARDFDYEVKEQCVSFVYETSDWVRRGVASSDFVSHEASILMECLPVGLGGLVAPSPKPLGRPALKLLKHATDVSGEIAYSICKYLRDKDAAEHAIMLLSDILRFAVLNGLGDCEKAVLIEFNGCERICREHLRTGHPFDAGLELLSYWKKDALSYRPSKKDSADRRSRAKAKRGAVDSG